jgi:DNA-binding MarR family transcriptional regulator
MVSVYSILEDSMRHGPTVSGGVISITEILRQRLESALEAVEGIKPAIPRSHHTTLSAVDVRRAIDERRNRDKFFPENLFADPAWDMLLELYAAELGQIRVATSSLCAGAAVPPTTALRWIGTLAREGLIDRHSDPLDGRRIFVRLSAKGVSSMEAYFQSNTGMLTAEVNASPH